MFSFCTKLRSLTFESFLNKEQFNQSNLFQRLSACIEPSMPIPRILAASHVLIEHLDFLNMKINMDITPICEMKTIKTLKLYCLHSDTSDNFEMLRGLPDLKHLHVNHLEFSPNDLVKIIQIAPKMHEFGLIDIVFFDFRYQSIQARRKVYADILRLVNARDERVQLDMIFNDQWGEFQNTCEDLLRFRREMDLVRNPRDCCKFNWITTRSADKMQNTWDWYVSNHDVSILIWHRFDWWNCILTRVIVSYFVLYILAFKIWFQNSMECVFQGAWVRLYLYPRVEIVICLSFPFHCGVIVGMRAWMKIVFYYPQ